MTFSKSILLLLLVVWIWASFNIKLWHGNQVIRDDVFIYYAYLPAIFIKHDIKMTFLDYDKTSYFNKLYYSISPTGIRYSKVGIGMAILYFPFFVIAHVYANFFGYPADGFSMPYHMFLCLSSVFYAFMGIVFLRKALLKFFPDFITGLTILSIVLGTNLLCYTTLAPAMSHAYSFFLFSLLTWLTLEWYKKLTINLSVFIGITTGLIAVTRPVDILVALIPFLLGVRKWKDSPDKIIFFKTQVLHFFIAAGCAFCVFVPQMFYWHLISGHWIFYSYTDEHFFFNHPRIEGLFSYRKGWLLYTPIMSFALVGFYFLRKKIPQLFSPLLIFFLLNCYLIISWWCWWYGGGFGNRAFIQSYALLAFPMACFFEYVMSKRNLLYVFSMLIFFCIALNILQTVQYKHGMIHYDSMTKNSYKAIFFKIETPDGLSSLFCHPDYMNAKLGIPERKDCILHDQNNP
jgi:hypothetical protein